MQDGGIAESKTAPVSLQTLLNVFLVPFVFFVSLWFKLSEPGFIGFMGLVG
jgi:hypothetical protein